jgi:hypothetical protein
MTAIPSATPSVGINSDAFYRPSQPVCLAMSTDTPRSYPTFGDVRGLYKEWEKMPGELSEGFDGGLIKEVMREGDWQKLLSGLNEVDATKTRLRYLLGRIAELEIAAKLNLTSFMTEGAYGPERVESELKGAPGDDGRLWLGNGDRIVRGEAETQISRVRSWIKTMEECD